MNPFEQAMYNELNSAKTDVSVTEGMINSSPTAPSSELVVRLMAQKKTVERIERVIAAYQAQQVRS
jgi:hypothetical protein